ncbi:hypothetical protein LJR029_005619 [Caballeronia sp. LjRoot29]|uniref:hypothetical protein n=1 Tax=Caballeronia sp. LjRoot29 TaxID=3342315 RepID=UPI003ECC2B8A
MKIKNYMNNRQQLHELFYEIAPYIKRPNIDSAFLEHFEIIMSSVQAGPPDVGCRSDVASGWQGSTLPAQLGGSSPS